MSMIKCKECGAEISSQAQNCPHCGAKLKKSGKFLKIVGAIIAIFIVLGIVANKSKTENSGENVSISSTQEKAISNNNEVANNSNNANTQENEVKSATQTKLSVVYEIPNRYAFIQINGVNPDDEIDENATLDLMKEKLKEYKVEQLQYVVYNQRHKYPDIPIRAFGELNSDENFKVADFVDIEKLAKELINNKESMKEIQNSGKEPIIWLSEKVLLAVGCYISPKELWQAYKDNEVVADEDFKGKPVLLEIKVQDGLKKDFTDSPYLTYNFEKYGLSGLHLEFDKKDPILRQIKKGQKLMVRAFPSGFIMDSVRLKVSNAKIIENR